MSQPHLFDKDDPFHTTHHDLGIDPNLKLTLDEFYLFDPTIKVKKISQHEEDSLISIEKACKSMRSTERACFVLVLSSDERLDELVQLPRIIEEKSMYKKYWPANHISKFFAPRNKIFYAFKERFRSAPYIAEKGLTQWLYIISGEMKIVLTKPTKINLLKYSTLTERDSFEPESKTQKTYTLKEGHMLAIPPGWISVKKANQTSFAFSGEILHEDCLTHQLELFDAKSGDPTADAEIRAIYWFYAMKLLECPSQHLDQLQRIKPHLESWRARSSKSDKISEPYVKPSFFWPSGIKIDNIVKDIQSRCCSRRSRTINKH